MPFADISVTEKYYDMVDDARIRKTKSGRTFFQTLAELQFESGYPCRLRGHGESGQPDRGQDHPFEPVLGDPAGVHAVGVQRRPVVRQSGQGHFVQPRFDEHRRRWTRRTSPQSVGGDPGADRGERPDPHLVGAVDRAGQQRFACHRARPDEPARLPCAGADLLRLRAEGVDFTNVFLRGAVRALRRRTGSPSNAARTDRELRSTHRGSSSTSTPAVGDRDRQGARAVRRCRHPHPDARGLGQAQGVGGQARHLQPEPAGRPAYRVDLFTSIARHRRSRRSKVRSARKARSAASTIRRHT